MPCLANFFEGFEKDVNQLLDMIFPAAIICMFKPVMSKLKFVFEYVYEFECVFERYSEGER